MQSLTFISTLGGRFELPSYESTSFPDLRLTRLGYPSSKQFRSREHIYILTFGRNQPFIESNTVIVCVFSIPSMSLSFSRTKWESSFMLWLTTRMIMSHPPDIMDTERT